MSWELVQVHERPDGSVEVLIRRRDKHRAFGGVLKPLPGDQRSAYPAGYRITDGTAEWVLTADQLGQVGGSK